MIAVTHLRTTSSSTPEVRLRFGFDKTLSSLCMLPSQPPQPVHAPAPAPPVALQPPPPRAAEPLHDDDDDKGKVSRWQIGSTSLSVLEQVYAMEPFPGAATLPGAAPARVWAQGWVPGPGIAPRLAGGRRHRAPHSRLLRNAAHERRSVHSPHSVHSPP